MTSSPDPDLDRWLAAWFHDGPTVAPDRVLDQVGRRLAGERQRPAWRAGMVTRPVPSVSMRILAVAAALLVTAVAGSLLVGGGGIGPAPTAAPSPAPDPTPTSAAGLLLDPVESLAPGTYRFDGIGGRTTFTVPDGWRVPTLGHLDFSIAPIDAVSEDAVRVFYDMRVASRDPACPEVADTTVGTTAAAIVRALGDRPGLVLSTPTPVTIGGLDGLAVDVTIAPGYTGTCPFASGEPTVPLIVDTVGGEGPFWGVTGTERERLIVLDRPSHDNVILIIDSVDGTTFDALLAAATPVLETFRFE